jgi:DNA-binding transcriptional LysR family regulator
VAPTEAGERLLRTLAPHLEEIDAALKALISSRETPSGTIRITAIDHSAKTVLLPALRKVLSNYPDIKVEITVDYTLTDIVRNRYDAGVMFGGNVAKDMIAVPLGPDLCMAAVAAPSYFAKWPTPQVPQDLTNHDCINMRLPPLDTLYAWEFEKDGHELRVRVDGQLVLNNAGLILEAALAGFGLAYLPEDQVRAHVSDGRLVRVLADWSPSFSGYHLYYPSRRQNSPAFNVVIDALRYRGS